ncbi:MAG: sigma-70 family RNA polymerase sigma factor [Kofleriaceae bacterium]
MADVPDARADDVATLVVAVRAGDRAAFTRLYERFHRVVHAIALAHVAAGNSDDVVQDVFAEVWLKIESLRDAAAFPGWIVTIARRRAVDHARKRGRIADADDSAIAPAPNPEALAALRALRELPDTYRETMIMRLVEGLTGPEIAERTGMTPESVRVHLHRGMKLLRDKLEAA